MLVYLFDFFLPFLNLLRICFLFTYCSIRIKLKKDMSSFLNDQDPLALLAAGVAIGVGAYHFGSKSSSSGGGSKKYADYSPNGEVAKRIASVTPYFPFKGIDRFYDIGGFLKDPEAFQMAIDVFVERYRGKNIDSICGFDARGFVLGPPIALALKKPFFMLRKKGKMPNSVAGTEYGKEYAGRDVLTIPRGAVQKGDRVLLIDDLVATGGTLCAGIELVKKMGGLPVECATVVEIKFLNARKKFNDEGHAEVPIWALMDEAILTLDGLKDPTIDSAGYQDDGEAH
jgi:adenine phosphoribosyltransferase